MTKLELSQLYFIDREIKDYEDKLRELEAEATRCTSLLHDMPLAKGRQDKLGAIVAEIAVLRDLIDDCILKRVREKIRLIRYIEQIDDGLIRQLIKYRFLNGMKYLQIAMKIGGGNTEDGVKMAIHRYINKN